MSVETLRARLQQADLAVGVRTAWTTQTLEGVLAHFVADDALVRRLVSHPTVALNTDDRNHVEFGFARALGHSHWQTVGGLRAAAIAMQADRPAWLSGPVDWTLVGRERMALGLAERDGVLSTESVALGGLFLTPTGRGGLAGQWQRAPFEPVTLRERLILARALAEAGNPVAAELMAVVSDAYPAETQLVQSVLQLAQGRIGEALSTLLGSVDAWRRQRWMAAEVRFQETALQMTRALGGAPPELLQAMFDAFAVPFPAYSEERIRGEVRLQLAERLGPKACVEAYGYYEPHTPWLRTFLERRLACYESAGDPRAGVARQELEEFREGEPRFSFEPPPSPAPASANGG
jgi:spermidine synthase